MRSERGVSRPAALALLPEARRRAHDFPNDPVAQGVLAEAEYDAGNTAECEAAADRALATDAKNVQALLYKGRARMRLATAAKSKDAAVWKEARGWFIKANRVDTDAAEPLMLFYQSFLAADQKPSESAVAGLMRAFELSPHDAGLRFMAIRQTLIDGNVKEARYMLIPLAFDPHAPRDNLAAKMVAMIDGGSAAPAVLAMMTTEEKLPADQSSSSS
jgi:tetratricopeptide (TPR) repeat protein